jgi:hypothetical protein
LQKDPASDDAVSVFQFFFSKVLKIKVAEIFQIIGRFGKIILTLLDGVFYFAYSFKSFQKA